MCNKFIKEGYSINWIQLFSNASLVNQNLKLFKEHIADGIKAGNIRSLFRVPEINDTNHLVVDAKEEDQQEEGGNINLPDNDVPAVPHDRAMKSYPIGRPNIPVRDHRDPMFKPDMGEERDPILRSGEPRRKVEKLHLIGAEDIEPVPGFNDPIYKYETKPTSINE